MVGRYSDASLGSAVTVINRDAPGVSLTVRPAGDSRPAWENVRHYSEDLAGDAPIDSVAGLPEIRKGTSGGKKGSRR